MGEDNFCQDENPVHSAAFHPSGYELAIGFSDKIRFFHIIHTELRASKEFKVK